MIDRRLNKILLKIKSESNMSYNFIMSKLKRKKDLNFVKKMELTEEQEEKFLNYFYARLVRRRIFTFAVVAVSIFFTANIFYFLNI